MQSLDDDATRPKSTEEGVWPLRRHRILDWLITEANAAIRQAKPLTFNVD